MQYIRSTVHFTHKVHYSKWKYSDSKLNNVWYSKGNQSVQCVLHVHVQAHADIDVLVHVHVHHSTCTYTM